MLNTQEQLKFILKTLEHGLKYHLPSLRIGDAFRFFDNGERYVNKLDGNNVWIATSEPYVNKDGINTIDTLY
jgi:hypothetical protein